MEAAQPHRATHCGWHAQGPPFSPHRAYLGAAPPEALAQGQATLQTSALTCPLWSPHSGPRGHGGTADLAGTHLVATAKPKGAVEGRH